MSTTADGFTQAQLDEVYRAGLASQAQFPNQPLFPLSNYPVTYQLGVGGPLLDPGIDPRTLNLVSAVSSAGAPIAGENANQGNAPMVVYDPMLGWYTPPTPLPPSMLTSTSGANLDLALGRSSGTGYNPTGPTGYNVANISQVNTLEGGRAVANQLGQAGCSYITNPVARAACEAVVIAVTGAGMVRGMMNGNGTPMGGMPMQNGGGGTMGLVGPCPPPLVKGPMGQCVNPMSPGGSDAFGTEVALGIFGIPSVAPRQVGSYGMGRPILRCGRGLVLGKDNRCYAKGSIPRSARKWQPEPKPLVSRSDVKALARIKSIKGRVKKAASSAGLSCAAKGTRSPKRGRK